MLPRTSFISIHSRLYLALYTEEQADRIAQHEINSHFLIVPLLPSPSSQDAEQNVISSSLEDIYKFDQMCQTVMRQNEGLKIVLCTGCDQSHQLKITFLLGCHMTMSHGLSSNEVLDHFKRLQEMFDADGQDGSMQSSWRAVSWAKQMGWIDFKETFDRGLDNLNVIQMDEYLHYARCCQQILCSFMPALTAYFLSSPQNGSIYTVVPQKFFLFKAPSTLPVADAAWLDVDGQRHFSAAFYADLLRDLGVTLVVGLGRLDYDRRTMERAGISVCTAEDLGCHASDEHLSFQVLDAFFRGLCVAA